MKEINTETEDMKVYELGLNLVSSLSEEQVPGQFADIKSHLEKQGAVFISEDMPKLRQLAYTMTKNAQGKNQKHDKAYFGWIKFELEGEKVNELKVWLERHESVLRHIIVKTVKENTLYSHKVSAPKAETKKDDKEEVASVIEAPAEVIAADEALDKTIDDLVVS